MTKNMKDLSIEERKEVGKISNVLKNEVTEIIEAKEKEINDAILNEKLKNEVIDISLPATKVSVGAPNILEYVIEQIEELFMSMG